MHRDPAVLHDATFDVVVIGGGVHGLCTAWDAALRGMRTALVEKGDFGGATSAGSYKIVHGGLRYLQHLDIRRMRVSIRERSFFLRRAPHLVDPLPFVIPCYGHGRRGPSVMRIALGLNDLISINRNRGLTPARHIPRGSVLSREACADHLPLVSKEGLTGGAQFYDAQTYQSERLTLAFALSADRAGARLVNYAEVTGFLRDDSRVSGVSVRDLLSNEVFEVRGRLVINTAGPWSRRLLDGLHSGSSQGPTRLSKGIQIYTRHLSDTAFAFESKQSGPKAIVSRGSRMYFVTPYRNTSFIGATDELYEGDPDDFSITSEDIGRFIGEINEALPGAELAEDDVLAASGGLRPVADDGGDVEMSKASHHYEITDQSETHGIDGLITAVGVKYTTCRFLAEQIMNLAERKLQREPRACRTSQEPLVGGAIDDVDAFLTEPLDGLDLSDIATQRLRRHYGSQVNDVVALTGRETNPLLPGTDGVLAAEVRHAVRSEMARHLDDVVFRRTDLGLFGHPGREALDAAAAIMATELDWDELTTSSEKTRVEDQVRRLGG